MKLSTVVVVAVLTTGCGASAAMAPASTAAPAAPADPLPSWNDGAAKSAILDFVKEVTTDGSPDFVAVPERIATFDNDGTLWAEQPLYFQLLFVVDRIRAMAVDHPEWKSKEPYKSVIAGDMKGLAASGEKGHRRVDDGDAHRHDGRRV